MSLLRITHKYYDCTQHLFFARHPVYKYINNMILRLLTPIVSEAVYAWMPCHYYLPDKCYLRVAKCTYPGKYVFVKSTTLWKIYMSSATNKTYSNKIYQNMVIMEKQRICDQSSVGPWFLYILLSAKSHRDILLLQTQLQECHFTKTLRIWNGS